MSPALFTAQLLLIFALALITASLVAGYRPDRATRFTSGWIRRYLDPQLDRASALGWTLPAWFGARAAAGVAGAGLGLLSANPVVAVGAAGVGFFGLPWYLAGLASRRRLGAERALVMVARNVVELIATSNQTIRQALLDVAHNPDPLLAAGLRPLADTDESIRIRLVRVARRFRSPVASRLCLDLLLALETTPAAFVEQAREVLIPQLEDDLVLQERNHAAVAGARSSGLIVTGIMAVALTLVLHVDQLRSAYLSAAGGLVLCLVAAAVLTLIWFMDRITPRPPVLEWDLEVIRGELERRYE